MILDWEKALDRINQELYQSKSLIKVTEYYNVIVTMESLCTSFSFSMEIGCAQSSRLVEATGIPQGSQDVDVQRCQLVRGLELYEAQPHTQSQSRTQGRIRVASGHTRSRAGVWDDVGVSRTCRCAHKQLAPTTKRSVCTL